jgi:hypothetical protein
LPPSSLCLKRADCSISDGIELIRERLSDYEGGNDDIWFAAVNEKIQRAIYCIREPMTDGIRNILMLIEIQTMR